MNSLMRMATALFLSALLLGILLPSLAGWTEGIGINSLPEMIEILRREKKREMDLAVHVNRAKASIRCKEETMVELLAGRLTLAEAAERFRQAHPEGRSIFLQQFRQRHPNTVDEEELWCRHVIHWASEMLRDEPARCMAIVARLQRELSRRKQTFRDAFGAAPESQ